MNASIEKENEVLAGKKITGSGASGRRARNKKKGVNRRRGIGRKELVEE